MTLTEAKVIDSLKSERILSGITRGHELDPGTNYSQAHMNARTVRCHDSRGVLNPLRVIR